MSDFPRYALLADHAQLAQLAEEIERRAAWLRELLDEAENDKADLAGQLFTVTQENTNLQVKLANALEAKKAAETVMALNAKLSGERAFVYNATEDILPGNDHNMQTTMARLEDCLAHAQEEKRGFMRHIDHLKAEIIELKAFQELQEASRPHISQMSGDQAPLVYPFYVNMKDELADLKLREASLRSQGTDQLHTYKVGLGPMAAKNDRLNADLARAKEKITRMEAELRSTSQPQTLETHDTVASINGPFRGGVGDAVNQSSGDAVGVASASGSAMSGGVSVVTIEH